MSEFRQNLATREWVIISTDRANKPMDFVEPKKASEKSPKRDPNCPFCPGNEANAETETLAVRPSGSSPGASDWLLRVIPNKYPALTPSPDCAIIPNRLRSGPYLKMEGCGFHEVIVENPRHNATIADMTQEEVTRILKSYWTRYHTLKPDCNNLLMTIFRNNGPKAGASLRHPHSQLITTGVVPLHIRQRLYEAQHYYDDMGTCPYCDILRHECKSKERIVAQNKGFVAFVPFAAGSPYEIWVMPRRHRAAFGEIPEEEIPLWAEAMQAALGKLSHLLGEPDYNYILQTAPYPMSQVPFYHWHVEILPQLKTRRAGFELGSGVNINTVSPEAAAEALRTA